MNAIERWDRTVVLSKGWGGLPLLGECDGIVRFRRNTRLFLAGDLAIITCNNGQAERYPIYGRSSRGYDVKHLYVQFQRWFRLPRFNYQFERDEPIPRWQFTTSVSRRFTNKVPVEWVELPGELTGKSVADPVVRRYVVERLCAADTASP